MSIFDFLLKRTKFEDDEEPAEKEDSKVLEESNGGEESEMKKADEGKESEVKKVGGGKESNVEKVDKGKESGDLKEPEIEEEAELELEEEPGVKKFKQTIFGIRFPWEAWTFVAIGALSEVVDALFMINTLNTLSGDFPLVNICVSTIVAAGCFFSMAFAGFQLGNRRYYSKIGIGFSYAFWAVAGLALVISRVIAGLVGGGLLEDMLDYHMGPIEMFTDEKFVSNLVIAVIQFVLYIGTGFMTRDSVRILTDNDIREYQKAKRDYDDLLDELSERRGQIVEDISKLKAYPKYAKRLIRSRRSVMKNVAQYNEAARALIEAKMAITVDPALMEEMYDNAMEKEKGTDANG